MDKSIRIVLAEDQSIIRQGLRYIIDAQPDMTVVGEAADGDQALQKTMQMAYGRRNAEIAAILCVSEGTVKTHVHHIIQKFGVEDRTQVVVLAIRQHLVH